MLVDVVDEQNRPIGVARRDTLIEKKLGFRTVHILLFNRKEELALQKLPANHSRNPNRLGSSVAGYLHRHETYAHAAERKLRSELGLTAALQDIGQVKMDDQGSLKFVQVYIGKLTDSPSPSKNEVAELLYLDEVSLQKQIKVAPAQFTPTFLRVYEHYYRWRRSK